MPNSRARCCSNALERSCTGFTICHPRTRCYSRRAWARSRDGSPSRKTAAARAAFTLTPPQPVHCEPELTAKTANGRQLPGIKRDPQAFAQAARPLVGRATRPKRGAAHARTHAGGKPARAAAQHELIDCREIRRLGDGLPPCAPCVSSHGMHRGPKTLSDAPTRRGKSPSRRVAGDPARLRADTARLLEDASACCRCEACSRMMGAMTGEAATPLTVLFSVQDAARLPSRLRCSP